MSADILLNILLWVVLIAVGVPVAGAVLYMLAVIWYTIIIRPVADLIKHIKRRREYRHAR